MSYSPGSQHRFDHKLRKFGQCPGVTHQTYVAAERVDAQVGHAVDKLPLVHLARVIQVLVLEGARQNCFLADVGVRLDRRSVLQLALEADEGCLLLDKFLHVLAITSPGKPSQVRGRRRQGPGFQIRVEKELRWLMFSYLPIRTWGMQYVYDSTIPALITK